MSGPAQRAPPVSIKAEERLSEQKAELDRKQKCDAEGTQWKNVAERFVLELFH
jgi:uncharacterized lipoprotein YmbA